MPHTQGIGVINSLAKDSYGKQLGIVFIPGAGLGGWVWDDVSKELNVPSLAVEYPAQVKQTFSLEDYANNALQQIDAAGFAKVVLVAHSLGGVVALRIADRLGQRLTGFVAVGAVIPKDGGSFVSALSFPRKVIMPLIIRFAGTKPPESAIRAGLCSDLSAEQADEIVKRFAPESKAVYTDRSGVEIPDVPRMYVKLALDKEYGPALEDIMAANLGTTDIPNIVAGHLPMLSQPNALADALSRFMQKLTRDLQ
jgi:pimeloyl-ACP methyl ester carboxylesterase